MDPHNLDEQRARDLVATYRRERMPADRRAAAWARLQDAIGRDDEEPVAPRRDRRRDLVWGVVLAAAAAVILIFGARGRLSSHGPGERDTGSQAAHEAARTTDPQAPVVGGASGASEATADAPAPESAASEVTVDASSAPELRRPSARGQDVPKDMPALDAELALLRAAREALARSAPAEALTALEQHARRFPAGHLIEERMLLRAKAQCELGRREEARASAEELVRTFPDSPHSRTVAGLCAQ